VRFFGEPQEMASQKFLIATEKWPVKVNEHVKEVKTCGCLSLSTPYQVNLALTLIK
jgi:hypothetical protein